MNRGDRREAIFTDDDDRRIFCKTLTETCGRTGWQVHAWCMLGKHFDSLAPARSAFGPSRLRRGCPTRSIHLVVETPHAAQFAVGAACYGVPWHICPTVALYGAAVVVDGHSATGSWRIVARERALTV